MHQMIKILQTLISKILFFIIFTISNYGMFVNDLNLDLVLLQSFPTILYPY